MKIKKFIILSLIIILMPISMLFGCETKKPKLLAYFDEETLVESKISLQLPINSKSEEPEPSEPESQGNEETENEGEESEEPKDPSKVSIIIAGENKTKVYEKGLDFSFNKQNIYLQISNIKLEDGKYTLDFQALMPGEIEVTIKTKDSKMKTTLNFEITQDIEKIELNENAKKFVVAGEQKAINIDQLINFTPQTTTKNDVILELVGNYEGVTLQDNVVSIDKNFSLSQICLKATSSEYLNTEKTDEEKKNLVIEQIYFDVIASLNDIVVIHDDATNNLAENVTLITNSTTQNAVGFVVKSKEKTAFNQYLEIPEGFKLNCEVVSEYKNFVLPTFENNTLEIKQNMKTGTCKVQVYAQNEKYPEYKSRVYEFNVEVLTAPTAITINGNRNNSSLIIYDSYANGLGEAIKFDIIGANQNLDTYISVSLKEAQSFNLVNSFGVKAELTNIKAGTTLYLSANSSTTSATETLITATVKTTNPNVQINLENRLEVTVKKNLADATVKDESGKTNNFILSKVNEEGSSSILSLNIIKSPEDAYYKSFSVTIENENIVKYIEDDDKSIIQLQSLTVGTTNVILTFDNGFTKEFTVTVFMPVDEIKINFSEEDRQTVLGKIDYTKTGNFERIYVKTGEDLDLNIEKYYKGKLVQDGTLIQTDYSEISNNKSNIALNNITNILSAINEGKDIKIAPQFAVYNEKGESREVGVSNFGTDGELLVDVYIPISSISLNKEFFTLYTEENLGYFDKNLSTDTATLTIEPANASYSKYITNPISCNVGTDAAEIETDTSDIKNVKITAKALGVKSEELDTISFSIREFDTTKTIKAYIRVVKAQKPETILVENTEEFTDGENTENALYFTSGDKTSIRLNPVVYPETSYNATWRYIIKNNEGQSDCITINENGVVTPIENQSGSCELILIPTASFSSETNYDKNTCKVIYITVADGSELAPYLIRSEEDFFNIRNNLDKNFVLAKNIDLTSYLLTDIINKQNTFLPLDISYDNNGYSLSSFSGSLNGERIVGKVKVAYDISGIQISISPGMVIAESEIRGNYYGLFAKNTGTIKNLTVYYSSVSGISTASKGDYSAKANANYSLNFGGIATQNYGTISNCKTTIYSFNVETYFGNNNVGGICAINNNTGVVEQCKVSGNANLFCNETSYSKNAFVGGIVGENKGLIKDTFDIYSAQTEFTGKSSTNSNIIITSLKDSDFADWNDSGFGLIAGKNAKNIEKVSSYGIIQASKNVGGIAGQNSGSILSSTSFSTVVGKTNVGGLVGKNTGLNVNSIIKLSSVMWLDDDDINAKIKGTNYVGGIIGYNDTALEFNYNFVRSYSPSRTDMEVSNATTFAGLVGYSATNLTLQNSFANFRVNRTITDANYFANVGSGSLTINTCYSKLNDTRVQSEGTFTSDGEIERDGIVGIFEPTKIEIGIKDTNLNEQTIGTPNKFIKANNTTILLYYYNNSNQNLNRYYIKTLFDTKLTYPSNIESQFSAIQSLVSDSNIAEIKDGYLIVKKTGSITITIQSLLNKSIKDEINVIIINQVRTLTLFANEEAIGQSKTIKTGDSFKLTFNEQLYQDNIYVSISSSQEGVTLNNVELGDTADERYEITNSFILKGISKGITTISVKVYYKIGDTYVALPLTRSFTLTVGEGISEFNLDINENSTLNIVPNSVINFNATISSDVLASTNLTVKVFEESNEENIELSNPSSANFNINVIKSTISGKSNFNISASLKNDISTENAYMVLIANDELYSYETIIANSSEYERYIKILPIKISHNQVYSVDMSFFANAETINDINYGNITNADEVESKYINIGRVGLLKLNVYPISTFIKSVELTYSNSDNLNLSISQVNKTDKGYLDSNKAQNILNGIRFNTDLKNTNGYLYAKLLTPAPIKENSEYTLYCKLILEDDTTFSFSKKLYTRLASSLEVSYDNAVLVNSNELVGVYAKGATNNQIVKLTVNRLQGYGEPIAHSSILGVELILNNRTNISNETTVYEYRIIGLENTGLTCDFYFTINKTANNKTEVIYSNTLKVTTVDFIVTGVNVENVIDGIFYKPYGTKYNLKVTLNTISNQSSEVISKINALQTEISNEIETWWENQNKLQIKEYGDFTITKEGQHLFITPNRVVSGNSLASVFKINYNNNGQVTFSKVLTYPSKLAEHSYSNNIFNTTFKTQFTLNFYLQTDMNNPIPVTTQEEFENMDTDGNYILLNDIVLSNYEPLDLDIKSLDGNGYTITVSSLSLNTENLETVYVGLFKSTLSTTILKNINVKYNLTTEQDTNAALNLSLYNQVYFGGLVAENDGLIYNCSVENFVEYNAENLFTILVNATVNTNNYISSFVAINNGYISNSHSELKLKVNRGLVGGFVSQNNKTIVSSYYKNGTIVLSGTNESTNKLGGFVQENNGTIKYCYIEGESRYNVANENGQYLSNKSLSDFCLMSPTNIGGFVYVNSGTIEDCYSNASIRGQSYSGGFVYSNSGKISRSYSACLNDAENNTAHAPFIASKINEDLTVQSEKLINCYYLNANTSTVNVGVVTGLSLNEFNNEYYLTNFIFAEDYGVFKFVDDKTLPTLVEANNVAVSQRSLYDTQENQDGSLVYNYFYTKFTYGSKENPIIIASEDEFLYYFSSNSTSRISNYFRLICDIDFSEYSLIPSVNYIFSGRLDGNGMKISGLSISAESGYAKDSFGLFNKIEKNSNLTPIIKNLIISPTKVHANNVSKVGTLAGVCEDGIILNVQVDASGVIVQGKNIVGGVVGEIIGESKLINVTSNVSVNAGYERTNLRPFLYISDETNTYKNKNDSISYAGSVAGVVNIDKYNLGVNEPIRNIEVSSKVKVIGEFVGLAFGGICENSGVDNIKVYVDNSSYINSLYTSGVVVGENRGYISRAQTINLASENIVLFKNEAHFIGGIAGFNNNGTIVNSISNVPVISENDKTFYAGGICGVTMGGSFSGLIATNYVSCNGTIGGLIGLSAKREILVYEGKIDTDSETTEQKSDAIYQIELNDYAEEISSLRKNANAIKENSIVFISNCLALNKYDNKSLERLNNEQSEGKTIGAIIGATSTTGETNASGLYEAYINVNYIYNNNYYIKYEETESSKKLNACGGINARISGSANIISQTTGKEIASELNESENENIFNTWSSSIWNIKDNFINLKNGAITSSVPTLKVVNNINSKKIEGQGTFASPYLISSAYGLVELAQIVENTTETINVKLTDNIDLTGKTISVIGKTNAFKGTFNGNGYTINGLTYNAVESSADNMFGLFGNNSANGNIINTNVVANMIIKCGRNVNRVGGIVANNKGYISNCNVYGGIICILQNINNNFAEIYVGGIGGVNAGESASKGIVYSTNYARIYVTSNDLEYSTGTNIDVSMYVGGIVGLNTNKAVINVCENKTDNTCELNAPYSIIAKNIYGTSNYLGDIYGFSNSTGTTQQNKNADIIYSEVKQNS